MTRPLLIVDLKRAAREYGKQRGDTQAMPNEIEICNRAEVN